MARGGYGNRPKPSSSSSSSMDKKRLSVRKKNSEKKASTKNQIRSIQRLLRKPLPVEVKEAQQQRLEELKKQIELHQRSELEKKMALRYRRVKFFERRKIERSIRRLEKMQRVAADSPDENSARQIADIAEQLADLKEDLEYVRFFPKTEKYVSLFMGGDDEDVISKRQKLREQIKANIVAAAAAGVDLEETGSDDDEATEMSEDDFFLAGSDDNADADDEWTDKTSRPLEDVDVSKNLALSTSRHIKNPQHYRKPSNVGSLSQKHGHKPQLHAFSNDRFKKRNISSKDAKSANGHPSSSKNNRFKERFSSSNNARALQGPPSNRAGIDRRTVAPNHPSSSNSSSVNKSAISTVGSSTSDTQQKKPRKRRPKKKK